MASVVFIIRVPFEAVNKAPDDDHLADIKEEPSSTDINAAPTAGQTNENVQNPTALDQEELSQATNKPTEPSSPESANVVFEIPQSIVEILQNVLEKLKVKGDSWQITKDEQFYQIMFIEDAGERVEKVLSMLVDVGIGLRPKTSVSVIPTSVHIQKQRSTTTSSIPVIKNENDEIAEETQSLLQVNQDQNKESTKDTFIKSIKSRLTVEQVVEGVTLQAQLTFDFVMFTILASLIAAVGLVEDNSVVLVASMLVSPLMGPILGGTFGTVINNKKLRNMGFRTEICGLTISVFVGFLFGFICGPFALDGASWSSSIDSWPTKEMSSRGMLRSLWVGVLIALPSGAGVALSVLGGNAGSLVGVAISASLLPPAVNSGMLGAYSIISAIKHPTQEINESHITGVETMCPNYLKGNNYTPMYSCHMGKEALIMAIISLVLTIVNIICILITATLVLKLKEVTARASSSNATQTFWTKDVKVARESYQTCKGSEATNIKNTFLKEWKKISHTEEEPQNTIANEKEFFNIIQKVEGDEAYQIVVGRVPQGRQYMHQYSRDLIQQISVEDKRPINEDRLASLHHLWTIHTQYSQHPKTAGRPRHVGTVFQRTTEQKPKTGRTFVVTETEKPHHTSVVRVRRPTEDSEEYSVLTESGV